MKKNSILYVLLLISMYCSSQAYEFKTIIDLEATDVISQGRTGTCWSFSASSFLESEIIRLTGNKIDISEMYNVRLTYPIKAWNYAMRQGKIQFSQGGLAHDVMNSISSHGLVPNSVYPGLSDGEERHDHSIMVDSLKKVLNAYIKNPNDPAYNWKADVDRILDEHLGENLTTFNYEGVKYTPQSFLKMTGLNPKDYITITSFTHKPYYSNFILNIPDNFSNGSFYNVTLNDMVDIVNDALENGFTLALDCDVSEKTFSAKHGIAVFPNDEGMAKDALTSMQTETDVTSEFRQQEFENYNTTDDHLMHITGMLKDQNGTTYYKVKNSWGKNSERVANNGYIFMSESYFKLKTISVMVHKDALSETLQSKLNLN